MLICVPWYWMGASRWWSSRACCVWGVHVVSAGRVCWYQLCVVWSGVGLDLGFMGGARAVAGPGRPAPAHACVCVCVCVPSGQQELGSSGCFDVATQSIGAGRRPGWALHASCLAPGHMRHLN